MSNRIRSTIGFTMPEEWLNIRHPVGRAIQNLHTTLALAYQADDPTGPGADWNEEYDVIEEEN